MSVNDLSPVRTKVAIEMTQLARNAPEYTFRAQSENLMRNLAKRVKRHHKVGVEFVKDADGNPILDRGTSQKRLGQFWGDKFMEGE